MGLLHRKDRTGAAPGRSDEPEPSRGESGVGSGIPSDWESLGRMIGVESLETQVIEHELDKYFAPDHALTNALLYTVHAVHVEKSDTSSCEHLIEAIEARNLARPAQAHVAFMFPDYNDVPVLCMEPHVRRFVRALHERVPHLLYFISPQPVLGQFLEFGAAFSPDESVVRIGSQVGLQFSDEFLDALVERLVAVWQFAERVGDDAERVVRGISGQTTSGIPADMVNDLIASVGRMARGGRE